MKKPKKKKQRRTQEDIVVDALVKAYRLPEEFEGLDRDGVFSVWQTRGLLKAILETMAR